MRKTQSIEIKGIGNFNIYPITEKKKEFNMVNSQGEEIKKIEIKKSIPAEYKFIDSKGVEYSKDRVFYNVYDSITQKVDKTDKLEKDDYEIIDKTEMYNLTESSFSILEADDTTKEIFNQKVGNNCISFILKKSSVGFLFYKAYIYSYKDVLIMKVGLGDIDKAVESFKNYIKNKEKAKEVSEIQQVTIQATSISKKLKNLI